MARARILAMLVVLTFLFTTAPPTQAVPLCDSVQMQSAMSANTMSGDTNVADADGTNCDGGGSSGGGSGPATFTATMADGTTITEITNPLERFIAYAGEVDETEADLVVKVVPLTLPPDRGAVTQSLENITDSDILDAMLLHGVTDEDIHQQIQGLLGTLDGFEDTAAAARNLLNNTERRLAAIEILHNTTPAEILAFCGEDRNPIQLRWPIGIPIMLHCENDPDPKAVAIWAHADLPALQKIRDEVTGEEDITDIDITFEVTPDLLGENSRSLVGATYKYHGAGAWTMTNRAWGIDLHLRNMIVATPDWVSLEYTSDATSFSADDRMYYTYGPKLSRSVSATHVLGTSPASYGMYGTWATGPPADPRDLDDGGWKLSSAPHAGAATPSRIEVLHQFVDENAIIAQSAGVNKLTFASEKVENAGGEQYTIAYEHPSPKASPPSDKLELKQTFYNRTEAIASTLSVGLPTFAHAAFDRAGASGDDVVRLDFGGGGDTTTGYFRTLLLTWHSDAMPVSAMGDYVRRGMLHGSNVSDPISGEPKGFVIHGSWAHEDWSRFKTHTETSPVESHVDLSHESTSRNLWRRGFPGAGAHTPIDWGNVRHAIEGEPAERNQYIWAIHPDDTATTSICSLTTSPDGVCM